MQFSGKFKFAFHGEKLMLGSDLSDLRLEWQKYESIYIGELNYNVRSKNYWLDKDRWSDLRACYFRSTGATGVPFDVVDLSAGASSEIVEILIEELLL